MKIPEICRKNAYHNLVSPRVCKGGRCKNIQIFKIIANKKPIPVKIKIFPRIFLFEKKRTVIPENQKRIVKMAKREKFIINFRKNINYLKKFVYFCLLKFLPKIHIFSMIKNFYFFILILFLLSFVSCIPTRKLKYVQDFSDSSENSYAVTDRASKKIVPYDELYITVFSTDEKTAGYFNVTPTVSSNVQGGLSLFTYTVNDSGTINFPYVGKIVLKDLTLDEARNKIQLSLNEYVEQSFITVKFVEKDITVLGEVNRPGKFSITRDQINVFQAFAMCGDLTFYANRNKITIIREDKGKITYNYIDVTDKKIVLSEFYYLKPNDIVYVEPLNAKFWGIKPSMLETTMTYLTYFSTIMSALALIISLSK